mmetsp:Transcript_26192/g.75641  ORF Transcript_26192/g.75641 Transcript_26192/m.75641 type:complete len:95 (+) Transcript_26192:1196-1480(+)
MKIGENVIFWKPDRLEGGDCRLQTKMRVTAGQYFAISWKMPRLLTRSNLLPAKGLYCEVLLMDQAASGGISVSFPLQEWSMALPAKIRGVVRPT